MRAVVQRVSSASVTVGGAVVGSIATGLCVLLGALDGDSGDDARFMACKLATLRIFEDGDGKMNRSVKDVGGGVLLVSQFTLAADTTSGTRPSFTQALAPDAAERLVELTAALLAEDGLAVEQGEFGAKMEVALVNDGPVTILLDSKQKKRK